ncbi:7TM-DISM domain-containing protein [Endozoicomonas sp.]|uniref:7TMR-DISM family protein n=1 Tax=Endozoicomonas sp. TaxID=1892382 RepID=UPI003D9BA3C5
MSAVKPGIVTSILLCIFLSLPMKGAAANDSVNAVKADRNLGFVDLTPYLELFRTKDKNLDIHTLVDNPLIRFTPVTDKYLNLAYSNDRIWLKFNIQNTSDKPIDLFVESGFSRLDFVSLHFQNDHGKWQTLKGGDRFPFEQRPLKTQQLLFPITAPAHSLQTFYIDVQSSSSLHIPLYITSAQSLIEISEQRYWADGLFYGICLMAILVGISATLIFKQRLFLYYFFQVASFTLAIMSLDGSGFSLWPNALEFQEISVVVFQCLTGIFVTLFARSYLHLKKAFPRADLVNRLFIGYAVLALISSPWLPYVVASFSIIVVESIMVVWILAQAIARAFQKYKPAYIFVAAWTLCVSVIVFVTFANLGISHNYSNTTYGLKIAFATQCIILLMGMAYRLHLYNKQQERIRQAALVARTENKAKNELLAKVSHEIRTPLNGIMGVVDLLSETGLNKSQLEHIATIQYSGNALLQILNDILDHSKIRSGKLQLEYMEYSPREVVIKVVDMFTPLASQKNLEFIDFFDERVPGKAWGDPSRLRQVLINLISNAIKFTHSGTVQMRVRLNADINHPQKQTLRFEIEDTGPGIAGEMENKLFNSFTQGDSSVSREHGGSGLGLSISRQLIELMGGEIGFKNLKTGSLFWFSLPVQKQS